MPEWIGPGRSGCLFRISHAQSSVHQVGNDSNPLFELRVSHHAYVLSTHMRRLIAFSADCLINTRTQPEKGKRNSYRIQHPLTCMFRLQ